LPVGDKLQWFPGPRLALVLSLFLATSCLAVYADVLRHNWAPLLKKQSLVAGRPRAPVALDFSDYWTASYMARRGEAAAVYDQARFKEAEHALTGVGGPGRPFLYPPSALLLDWPLSLLPYFLSVTAWLAVTLGLFLLVLYCVAPHPLTLFWALGFFGTFENFYLGQNGFLSAALLGGGLLLLSPTPFLGGVLLGLLSFKPQIATLIPLALLAGRQWRALAGCVVSAACLALGSLAVFGYGPWEFFFSNIGNSLNSLYNEASWFYKMPSLFAAARLAGLSVRVAWGFQGLAMLASVVLVVWMWGGKASPALRATALVAGILLFTPHIYFYDTCMLAIPLAWIWWEGNTRGWLPLEPFLLLLAWLMPYANFLLLVGPRWPLGPLYLALPLILIIRRYRWEMPPPGPRVPASQI
jgi:Glycosyltransferase family 87